MHIRTTHAVHSCVLLLYTHSMKAQVQTRTTQQLGGLMDTVVSDVEITLVTVVIL